MTTSDVRPPDPEEAQIDLDRPARVFRPEEALPPASRRRPVWDAVRLPEALGLAGFVLAVAALFGGSLVQNIQYVFAGPLVVDGSGEAILRSTHDGALAGLAVAAVAAASCVLGLRLPSGGVPRWARALAGAGVCLAAVAAVVYGAMLVR